MPPHLSCEGRPETTGHGWYPTYSRRLPSFGSPHPLGAGTEKDVNLRGLPYASEGCTKTATSRLTSNDDSNSSTKVLLDGLGAPGVACRSDGWPGSPGGGGGGPGGCPVNIPPRDDAMTAMAGGNATGPVCAGAGSQITWQAWSRDGRFICSPRERKHLKPCFCAVFPVHRTLGFTLY